MATRECLTIEDLDLGNMPDRWELIRGEVIERQWTSAWAARVGMAIAMGLWRTGEHAGRGRAFMAETGFVLDAGRTTLAAPNAAFVTKERLGHPDPHDFVSVAPDIAVEVLSPFERLATRLDLVSLYLEGGSTLVWLVLPEHETVTVFTQDAPPFTLVGDDAVLGGGDVLPEFRMTLGEIFDHVV